MVGVGVISKMREILVIGVGEVYKFQIPVEGVGDVSTMPTNPCGVGKYAKCALNTCSGCGGSTHNTHEILVVRSIQNTN